MPGQSVAKVARSFQEQNVVRSTFWFTNFILLLRGETQIVSGEYYFERPLSAMAIAKRITTGDFHVSQMSTTIPEGSSISEIAVILKKNYPEFDTTRFMELARGKEGFLFPDTYHFGSHVTAEKVVDVMADTFQKKITRPEIQSAIDQFGVPLKDVVTMASILEGEARQMQTRQIVAGILWNRIKIGMPLQVDVTFKYINGKTTATLTLDDLKIKSPYNTYVYTGLPPGPISNPGIAAIQAAVTPIDTNYLFFLTDNDGNMRYARTLEEHAKNKRKYLSN
jgi:UPF0755 protein